VVRAAVALQRQIRITAQLLNLCARTLEQKSIASFQPHLPNQRGLRLSAAVQGHNAQIGCQTGGPLGTENVAINCFTSSDVSSAPESDVEMISFDLIGAADEVTS